MCWKCNKKGHVQSNCPEHKQQESGMVASQKEEEASNTEVSFMATNNLSNKKHLWIGNTGASTCMKNYLEGLYDLCKEDTIVKIGNGTGLKLTTVSTLKAIVQQEDGTLRCTPFHVRFGKLGVLQSLQNKVNKHKINFLTKINYLLIMICENSRIYI